MYYIYHIPGVKIGCTNNIERRMKEQGFKEYQILEQHKDVDIASQREKILQKEYGYKIDSGYSLIIKLDKTSGGRVSAKKQWKEKRELELLKSSKGGKANSLITSKVTHMCDLDGNIIMSFKNRKDAAKYINGFAAPLTNVINHLTRTYKGFKWKD